MKVAVVCHLIERNTKHPVNIGRITQEFNEFGF